jgi:hypothetical protein
MKECVRYVTNLRKTKYSVCVCVCVCVWKEDFGGLGVEGELIKTRNFFEYLWSKTTDVGTDDRDIQYRMCGKMATRSQRMLWNKNAYKEIKILYFVTQFNLFCYVEAKFGH